MVGVGSGEIVVGVGVRVGIVVEVGLGVGVGGIWGSGWSGYGVLVGISVWVGMTMGVWVGLQVGVGSGVWVGCSPCGVGVGGSKGHVAYHSGSLAFPAPAVLLPSGVDIAASDATSAFPNRLEPLSPKRRRIEIMATMTNNAPRAGLPDNCIFICPPPVLLRNMARTRFPFRSGNLGLHRSEQLCRRPIRKRPRIVGPVLGGGGWIGFPADFRDDGVKPAC